MTGPERSLNRRLDLPTRPEPELEPIPETAPVADPVHPGAEPAPLRTERAPLTRPRHSRSALWTALAVILVIGVLVGAWYALPVRTVTVTGNAHLSPAQVQKLAGLPEGFGWLYYGRWRARGLLADPWVQSAVVTRTFPDRVTVQVTERTPYARWQRRDGRVVAVARDGTPLPGAPGTPVLPLVRGWGPDRVPEVLHLLSTLARYNVQSVSYTPTGVTVKLPSSSVWSGDLRALVKYAGSISMYPNSDIYIYPWGVSVQE